VTKVSATSYSSFALLDDGTVSAWGRNTSSQLVDGTTTNRTTAVPIDALGGVQDIAGGVDYTLAALDDG
jgi:alpha-tubulin suppressor-like RCC1 family protein